MDPLTNLAAIRTVWDQRGMWVVEARNQRVPWDQIAEALGVSRQTAINLFQEASRNSMGAGVR